MSLREELAHYVLALLHEIAVLDSEIILFVVLLISGVIVLDALTLVASRKKKDSGVSKSAITISIDGGKTLKPRHYVSEIQGLAGKPDAVIVENGSFIPIERKPLARKVHDRYIAQLLVYMRLIEEFEGKKPPHGYLILGPKCKRIKIENSDERQAWLQKILDEMQGILHGAPAKATPHPRKCAKCDVKDACKFKLERSSEPPPILSKSPSLAKSV